MSAVHCKSAVFRESVYFHLKGAAGLCNTLDAFTESLLLEGKSK